MKYKGGESILGEVLEKPGTNLQLFSCGGGGAGRDRHSKTEQPKAAEKEKGIIINSMISPYYPVKPVLQSPCVRQTKAAGHIDSIGYANRYFMP
jgi:hypothetical protein